jgi:hypothetical protein
MCAEERHEPGHHVHFDVAVDQEIAAKMEFLRAMVRVTAVFEPGREQQHRGCLGLEGE